MADNIIQAGGWEYETVSRVCGVKVQVPMPDEKGYFKYFPSFVAENGEVVSDHWRKGIIVPGIRRKLEILGRFYYGITEADFGTEISTTTVIKRKVRGDEAYLQVEHHKSTDPCTLGIRFTKKGKGISIHDSLNKIVFVSLK